MTMLSFQECHRRRVASVGLAGLGLLLSATLAVPVQGATSPSMRLAAGGLGSAHLADASITDWRQSEPRAALDPLTGDILVVWTDERHGNKDVYAQRIGPDGQRRWISDVQVNPGPDAGTQASPQVVALDDGTAVVMWNDSTLQRLNADGAPMWSTPVILSGLHGSEREAFQLLAATATGQIQVAYVGITFNVDTSYHVWMARVDRDGHDLGQIDTGLWVSFLGMPGGFASSGSAGISDGRGAFVLHQFNEDFYFGSRLQRIEASGAQRYGSAIELTSSLRHALALAADDAVWLVGGDAESRRAQRLDGNGQALWPQEVRVNDASGSMPGSATWIDTLLDSRAMVLWPDTRTGAPALFSQGLDRAGSRFWSADVRVTDATARLANPGGVDTAASADLAVVWSDTRGDSGDIYLQRIGVDGQRRWSIDVRVSDFVASDALYLTSLQHP